MRRAPIFVAAILGSLALASAAQAGTWLAPEILGPQAMNPANQDARMAAISPSGVTTFAYIEFSGTGGQKVMARQMSADGILTGQSLTVSDPANTATEVTAAAGPDGTATIVWSRRINNAMYEVEARQIAPDGTLRPQTYVVSSGGTTEVAAGGRVVVDSAGRFTIVWEARNNSTDTQVQSRRLSSDGVLSPTTIVVSTPGQRATTPDAAVAANGDVQVGWTNSTTNPSFVEARRLGADGAPSNAVATLSALGQISNTVRVGVAADGSGTILWRRRSDGTNLTAQTQKLNAAGAVVGTPQDITPTGEGARYDVDLSVAPDGTALVSWVTAVALLRARRVGADGTPATAIWDFNDPTTDIVLLDGLATSGTGEAMISYGAQHLSPYDVTIYAQPIPAGGAPGTPAVIGAPGLDQAAAPFIAGDPLGAFSVTWGRVNNGMTQGDRYFVAPAGVTPPTISGTPAIGQTLTAIPGVWAPTPTGVTYVWQRCNAQGAGCVDIAGATGLTYVVTAADVGFTLRIQATGTNSIGSRTSDSTTVTVSAPPTPGPTPGPTPTPKCALKLTKLGLSRAAFTAGRRNTALAAAAGSTIRYSVSCASVVRVRFVKMTKVKPGPHKPPRGLVRSVRAGADLIPFTARMGGSALTPGRWKLYITAKASGVTTRTQSRIFTVMR